MRTDLEETCPYADIDIDQPELSPLAIDSDRRDIHRRLVGPLAAVTLIKSMDALRQEVGRGSYLPSLAPRQPIVDTDFSNYYTVNKAFSNKKVAGQEIFLFRKFFSLFSEDTDQPFMTQAQEDLCRSVTSVGNLNGFVYEGFRVQKNATFNIALPAYLIAAQELKAPTEVVKAVREMGLEQISKLVRQDYFTALLSRLAITANGLYGDASYYYVDDPAGHPVLAVSDPLSPGVVPPPDDIPDSVNIFELFEKGQDGAVALTAKTISTLKYFLNFRNNRVGSGVEISQLAGTSAGCPVVQKSVRIRQDDLTEKQWKHIIEGKNPIGSYDLDHQLLRFHRSVFEETALFLADCLSGKL